jgi:hypothetical protein
LRTDFRCIPDFYIINPFIEYRLWFADFGFYVYF